MSEDSHSNKIIGIVGLVQLKKLILPNNLLQLAACSSCLGKSGKEGNAESNYPLPFFQLLISCVGVLQPKPIPRPMDMFIQGPVQPTVGRGTTLYLCIMGKILLLFSSALEFPGI